MGPRDQPNSPSDVRTHSRSRSDATEQLDSLSRMGSRIEHDIDRAETEDAKPSKTPKLRSLWDIIWYLVWPSLILDHLDASSLKVILRSWSMMWALTLLCICDQTAEFMGPSSFLANFAGGIEIAGNLSVSAAFVYCMGDLVSLIFAFLVSVVTMGINWRIRGYPSEATVIEELLKHGRCAGIEAPSFSNCIEPEMHTGFFLDIKTTVVTIFGMLFSFSICGYFQSTSKYGKLAWLLNALYTIIVFPFNNMMPVWRPWIFARNCVVPMSMAFAARFFVSLVVLPFSSNYKVVSSLAAACTRLRSICDRMQSTSKGTRPSKPGFTEEFSFISSDTQTVFTKLIINEVDMEMVKYLEVWFSRFERPDLTELKSQLRLIMSALSSFHFFYEAMSNRYWSLMNSNQDSSNALIAYRSYRFRSDQVKVHKHAPNRVANLLKTSWKDTGMYELRQKQRYLERLLKEYSDKNSLAGESDKEASETAHASAESSEADTRSGKHMLEYLDDEYIKIIENYEPLVKATCDLLSAVSQWLEESSNITPWLLQFWNHSSNSRGQAGFDRICKALQDLTHEIGVVQERYRPSDSQYALYDFAVRNYARRVKQLARWSVRIHNERPNPVLVWPYKRRTEFPIPSFGDDDLDYDGFHDNIGTTLERTYTSFKPIGRAQARNPDSTPPREVWHILGLCVLKIRCWLYDPTVLFCIKRAVLTTTTLTPYFCKPTCHLAYKHWFLWVAVLTAYTVGRQAVDGIYGLVAKFVYTFFGCLVGMVGWYISAGSGRGSPYGYAAVTAFIWLYICYQRQFNHHFIPATSIVYSCTVTLVLGNSWNSGHIALPGVDLGRGFSVAWLRFVTVTIGITVSFLGTIFPYAYTAKQAVREIIGNCLEHLGDLHASISNFGIQRHAVSSTHIIATSDVVTRVARAIITNLNSAETLRKILVYEPPLAGIYPTHRYKLLINYLHEITLLYSLTYALLDEMRDTSKIPHILRIMGWTDPVLSTGVYSLVYMSGRALSDGKALPTVTSGNLLEHYSFHTLPRYSLRADGSPSEQTEQSDTTIITAVALSSQIYERLDGVIILIKELVGEIYDLDISLFDFDLERQVTRPFANEPNSLR